MLNVVLNSSSSIRAGGIAVRLSVKIRLTIIAIMDEYIKISKQNRTAGRSEMNDNPPN